MSVKNKKILGIIAARGGSKRIPRKNIREINGKPLVYYTIMAAKESRYLTDLILSSDDEEIIQYAKSQMVEVPFRRPDELANDEASSIDVVIHALDFMEEYKSIKYDYTCLLEPTSPLRRSIDIDTLLENLANSNCDSSMSLVMSSCRSPYRIRYIEDGEVKLAYKDKFYDFIKNKSKYPHAYLPGGGIFCSNVESMRKEKVLAPGKVKPYVMKSYWGVDIDEIDDFIIAECLLKQMNILNGDKQ
ncbi:MAG: acylneuraminate cytidylyltransferase family protein [Candidatus Brocadiaceae bacterium]|nr:acylneuraminate cytidylyltransferase family protein [Candidatus Brocadiaceae bacterium]